jgi:hypothetical protein
MRLFKLSTVVAIFCLPSLGLACDLGCRSTPMADRTPASVTLSQDDWILARRPALSFGANVAPCQLLLENIAELQQVPNSKSIWPGYESSLIPMVIIDGSSKSNCAVYSDAQVQKEIHLESPVVLENGVYDFMWDSSQGVLSKPPGLVQIEKLIGQKTMLIFNPVSDIVAQIAKTGPPPWTTALLNRFLIIHEGFHLYGEKNLLRSAWKFPAWPTHPLDDARDQIDKIGCYESTNEVREIFHKEMSALREASRLGLNPSTQLAARESLGAFRQFREARYRALSKEDRGTHVPHCPLVESRMEILEGFADYVALATLMDSGLIRPKDVLSYMVFTEALNEPYYRFGALQLLTLRQLDRGQFLSILKRLSESKDWSEGIFSQTRRFSGNATSPPIE